MGSNENRIEELVERLTESWDSYSYIKRVAKMYWHNKKVLFKMNDVATNLMCTASDLIELRKRWLIKTYDSFCYLKWGKEGCLNLLEEDKILLPSKEAILDKDIQTLIENICWHKPENIEYLHKALLYKYLNINDHTVPAVIFYGMWGSGKGTYLSLLETIFWETNILSNLWQRDITGGFDTYTGKKIAVEFAEISTNNTNKDYGILNKLKNLIGADMITVNEKGIQPYQIENIAWFFISSNSNHPIQLDDKDKWNRRFSVIRSESQLTNGDATNKAIRDKEKVANYLAWLHKEYPDVLTYKKLDALDNQDKKDLEDRSQNESNNFWERFKDNNPDLHWKHKLDVINIYITDYCNQNEIDEKEFKKYFWNTSRYNKKKIRIWDKTCYGVIIPKSEILTIEDAEEIF